MSEWMRKILESKRKMRQRLAARPFSEKVQLLEKLRDRGLAIGASPLRRDGVNLPAGIVREKPSKKYSR